MNGTDEAVELIVRNQILLAHAVEARVRAQELIARTEYAVLRASRAMLEAERKLRAIAPQFKLPSRCGTTKTPRIPAELREQAAKCRRYAHEFAGDEAEKRLRDLANRLEAEAAAIEQAQPNPLTAPS
jgi:hypothetical protein